MRHFTALFYTWILVSQNWSWALSLQNYSSTLIFKTESSTAVSRFPQNCAFKTVLYYKLDSSCSISLHSSEVPKLIPATFDPLDKLQTSFRSKSWSSSVFVFHTAVSIAVLAMRPLSSLQCDRPCRSNLGAPAEDGLARTFQKVLHVCVSAERPWHSPNSRFFPSSAPKPELSWRRHSSSHVSATTSGSVCRPDWSRNQAATFRVSANTQTPLRLK